MKKLAPAARLVTVQDAKGPKPSTPSHTQPSFTRQKQAKDMAAQKKANGLKEPTETLPVQQQNGLVDKVSERETHSERI